LGAKVLSFDYDGQSVACTRELKRRYFENDGDWTVQSGSVLDLEYLVGLGTFDIVYSWGVLHHTGDMWTALENVDRVVAHGGRLFVALYNFQPFFTKYWTFVKRTFNRYPLSRPVFLLVHSLYPTLPRILLRFVQGRRLERGMSAWRDLVDWLGGYPFEASKPEEIFAFYRKKGYHLMALKTVGGRHGCNEFVFEKRR
jgi:2-polyprenyl-6-hydroxyphenyl methylase/3-demethylubiquinone-9 3-methyltransferase